MNAKTAHVILEIAKLAGLLATAITAQPALQNKPWVPCTFAVLTIIATVGSSFVVGNIPPTNPPAA